MRVDRHAYVLNDSSIECACPYSFDDDAGLGDNPDGLFANGFVNHICNGANVVWERVELVQLVLAHH